MSYIPARRRGRRRRGAPRGSAYNHHAMHFSEVARSGGPVRLSLSAIDRNSSRTSIYVDARAQGWTIYEAGSYLIIVKSTLAMREVVGVRGADFIYAV